MKCAQIVEVRTKHRVIQCQFFKRQQEVNSHVFISDKTIKYVCQYIDMVLVSLHFGVTVRTVCDDGDPWTSGGFLTEQVKVPLSFNVALIREMEASPRAGVPCHSIRPAN